MPVFLLTMNSHMDFNGLSAARNCEVSSTNSCLWE